MSGLGIAKEVAAALKDAATATGSGEYLATFKRVTSGPATPWDNVPSTETETQLAVIVGSFDKRLIDGENIQTSDLKVLVEAIGFVPVTSDRVVLSGVEYAILAVKPLSPAGTDIMYELQCRA